jgi:hypothetical protein
MWYENTTDCEILISKGKRMKKLVMAAIVAAICSNGWAEVLVYKFNTSYKMIDYSDPNRTVGKSRTETIKAYVVFNIDSNTPLHTVRLDAGNKPTAILYGHSRTAGNWKKTIGGDDPNSSVLIATAESDIVGFQTFNTYTVLNSSKQKTEAKFTLTDNVEAGPFEIVADMRGSDKKTGHDLFPTTIYLPWNLSGITSMVSGDETTPTFVTGKATSGKLKMDFPRVQSAVNHDWNVAQTIADINASETLANYPDLGTAPIPVP